MSERKARLGFVGLGTMGCDLLKGTVKNPKAEVSALCDIAPKALEAAHAICAEAPAAYADYRDLIADDRLDGVVVATPQDQHAEISIAALNAGRMVFCEKPMGLNVKQCRDMIAASERNGKGLMIGQVLRFISVYRFVLEEVKSGAYGKPFAVRIMRSGGGYGSFARPWRQKRELTGGLLMEINAHEIDFMLQILGEAVSVQAVGDRFVNMENDYEDFIDAQVSFRNGGIGTLTSTSCDHLGRYLGEIFLENGTFYYDSLPGKLWIGKKGEERREMAYADIHPEWEDGVSYEMREFVEACLGEHPIPIPGEDGLRVVEVAEACYRSINERGVVTLPL